MALVVKTPPADAGDPGDAGLIPGPGRCPEEGNGSPNPVDRGAWRATVHGVAQSWTQLKRLSSSSSGNVGS